MRKPTHSLLMNIYNLGKKRFGLMLFLLAIVSGVIWGAPFDHPLRTESQTFDQAALVIMEKGFFNNDEIMNSMVDRKLYPYFLAGVYTAFGHHPEAVRYIQVLIFGLLAFLAYKLAQLVFDDRLARLAGFLTALCWSIASFVGWLHREVMFTMMIVLLIYLLYLAQKQKKWYLFISAGAMYGLVSLMNAIVQFWALFVIVNFIILLRKQSFKKTAAQLALFLTSFVIVIAPFFIADYIYFQRTPFLSKEGMFLADRAEKMLAIQDDYWAHVVGNATGDFIAKKIWPNYDGTESRYGWKSREWYRQMLYEEKLDKEEIDQRLTDWAKPILYDNPTLFVQASFIDFLKFNTPMVPDVRMQHMFAVEGSYPNIPDWVKVCIILGIRLVYLIFFALIIYAIVKYIKDWSRLSWIFLIVIYFNGIFSNLHAIARYSVPIYPFYIILFSVGILSIWDRYIRLRKID